MYMKKYTKFTHKSQFVSVCLLVKSNVLFFVSQAFSIRVQSPIRVSFIIIVSSKRDDCYQLGLRSSFFIVFVISYEFSTT